MVEEQPDLGYSVKLPVHSEHMPQAVKQQRILVCSGHLCHLCQLNPKSFQESSLEALTFSGMQQHLTPTPFQYCLPQPVCSIFHIQDSHLTTVSGRAGLPQPWCFHHAREGKEGRTDGGPGREGGGGTGRRRGRRPGVSPNFDNFPPHAALPRPAPPTRTRTGSDLLRRFGRRFPRAAASACKPAKHPVSPLRAAPS